MDFIRIYDKTAKYRSVREITKDMVSLTLVRIAKDNAYSLLAEIDGNMDAFKGLIIGYDHLTTTVALFKEITDDSNQAVHEIFGLAVAILGELFLSDMGTELLKSYDAWTS
jgi:hypothetical protein